MLALVTISVLLLDAIVRAGRPPFVDWFVYHDTVERGLAGASLFHPRQLVGAYAMPDVIGSGSAYPPASIPILIPFSLGIPGLLAWLVVSFGLFLTGLWAALRRDLGVRALHPFAFVLLGLMVFLPFADAVITANVNVVIAGMYAWSWALGRSAGRVGVLAAVGAAMKLFPTVLVLWPTGRARIRAIACAAATFGVLTILSLPVVGIESWAELIPVLTNRQPLCTDVQLSIPCALAPSIGMAAARAVALGTGAVLLLAALSVRGDRIAFVLFGGAMLAPVADMHPHYWLIAFVAGVVVVGGLLATVARRGDGRSQAVAATPAERAATAAAPSS